MQEITAPPILSLLIMDDTKIKKHITAEYFKASGPGGQKINKTMTAVRLRIPSIGVVSESRTHRTQGENYRSALRKLRLGLSLLQKEMPDPSFISQIRPYLKNGLRVNEKNSDFPLVRACVSGTVSAHNGNIKTAAEELGTSTNRLIKFLHSNRDILTAIHATGNKNDG